ncbi:hypothetical protein V6N12_001219 [Hibiscus sabdariffa]|uniref:Uncharacterized protein n=1 Tax=Hibiscus sabdariffa TaxID=183260 RepID=A0ABR2C6L2_9ROSI
MQALQRDTKGSVNKSCLHCRRTFSASNLASHLQLGNYSTMEGVLYCKPHFEQLFKETGNFSKKFQSHRAESIIIGDLTVSLFAGQVHERERVKSGKGIAFCSFFRYVGLVQLGFPFSERRGMNRFRVVHVQFEIINCSRKSYRCKHLYWFHRGCPTIPSNHASFLSPSSHTSLASFLSPSSHTSDQVRVD